MPNLAVVLKEEIRRLAKKEVGRDRQDQAGRGPLSSRDRPAEAGVGGATEGYYAAQGRQQRPVRSDAADNGEGEEKVRFSARSVRSQRRRLGLSAHDYGKLVGVSGLTVYHWEGGKSRPRKAQLDRLVAVRNLGKREAARAPGRAQSGEAPQAAVRLRAFADGSGGLNDRRRRWSGITTAVAVGSG